MINISAFILASLLIITIARKIKKNGLNRIQYYFYVPLYIATGAQYYSIFNFGMIHNGLEVDVIFFKSFFSTFLPNIPIQISSLAIDAYLLFFCFPKHYSDKTGA